MLLVITYFVRIQGYALLKLQVVKQKKHDKK